MKESSKIESQLERLLAQDLSQMGYQARIRHQQRIEELRALHEGGAADSSPPQDCKSVPVLADQPAG